MTNVPNELRDIWTDAYKLFDVHYKMENTTDAWATLLNHCKEVWEKHGQSEQMMILIHAIVDMIGYQKKQEETANAERSA